jgi:hypothetical protein
MTFSIPWNQSFNTAFSPFNPAAAFGAPSPLSFAPSTFDPASAFGGLGAAAGVTPATGAAAPALAGAAGGAGDFLSMAGGPMGMAATAIGGIAGGLISNVGQKRQMEGMLQAQREADKFNFVGDHAFTRAYQTGNIADQMNGLRIRRTADKLGFRRPEMFQGFLNAGMPTTAARHASFFNV